MSPTCRHNPRIAGRARKAVLCAALALAGGAAAMPAAVQRVELTWKLEPGTELVYRESQQFETELPQGMGASSVRSESTQRWSVLEVDGDGNATVRLTTEQAQMNLDLPMGATSVDSADQGGPGTLPDANYTVVLDPRGVVIEMSGLEEMREALREQAQDLSSPILATLDGMLSDEALRGRSAQDSLALPLPTEPVGVGSTWDSDFTCTDSRLRVDDGCYLLPRRVDRRRHRRHRQLRDDVPAERRRRSLVVRPGAARRHGRSSGPAASTRAGGCSWVPRAPCVSK